MVSIAFVFSMVMLVVLLMRVFVYCYVGNMVQHQVSFKLLIPKALFPLGSFVARRRQTSPDVSGDTCRLTNFPSGDEALVIKS